jgi:hypothetical protein
MVSGVSRIHSHFKDIGTFYGAWFAYVAIRTHFQPSRTGGLMAWTENVQNLSTKGFPWANILDYIVKYFQKYQNASLEKWSETDPELISTYVTLPATKPALLSQGLIQPGGKRPNAASGTTPLHEQVCENYNRPGKGCNYEAMTGRKCGRLHSCLGCKKAGHPKYQCPSGPQSNGPQSKLPN